MLGCYVGARTAARGVPERFLTGVKTEKETPAARTGEDQAAAGKENKPNGSEVAATATQAGEPMEVDKA